MAAGLRQRLAALTGPKAGRKELLDSRSVSVAGRFHPVVGGLHDSINALRGWTDAPAQAVCTAWIGAGMDHLGNLLSGLTDLLHHPQVQGPERQSCQTASSWTERLHCDLVLLADAHGSFCEVLVSLKQLLAEAQAAVRHRDAPRLAAALRTRTRRDSDRALSRLASTLRALSRRSSSSTAATSDSSEAALVEAATCATAAASATIFAGLASASASSDLRALTTLTDASPETAMERLRSLEECVVAVEDGCEQVHRALVNTMESLLNVLTVSRPAKLPQDW